MTDAEADEYYASRARGSRIGAWASKQSRPLESRFALEKAVAEYTAKFGLGDIPRPPHWSGFRLKPRSIEFWHDRKFRLHDRVEFKRIDGGWDKVRMYPIQGRFQQKPAAVLRPELLRLQLKQLEREAGFKART